jgi:beta-glucosidase
LFFSRPVSGQSGDFTTSGKVVSGGQPLAGATATYTSLAKRLSWDFSDQNGAFGPLVSGVKRPVSGDVSLSPFAPGDVRAELYTVLGRKVADVSGADIDKGAYSIPAGGNPGRGLYLLKVTAGDKVWFQKLLCTGGRNVAPAPDRASSFPAGTGLWKAAAIVDTVRVGKTGYAPVKVAISAYAADIGTVTLTKVNIDSEVTALFGQMSQAEKVGQLLQLDCPGTGYVTSSLIGTVFGGGTDGPSAGSGPYAQWATFNDGYQQQTANTPHKIPMLTEWDVIHGFGHANGATLYPHNIGLGCTWDTIIVQKCFRIAAIESRGCGCNLGYGPCIAVVRDDHWGRTYEGFSESPDLTKVMARAAVLGYQTTDLSNPLALAGCVKHFAGDGGTQNGVNCANTVGTEATLEAIHLPGYIAAINAGVASVMASYSAWNGTRMHQNQALLTTWLKTGQGFDGYVNGDWSGDIQYGCDPTSCLRAGLDVPMRGASTDVATNGVTLNQTFNNMYNAGGTDQARIIDAVKRLLRLKFKMDLFHQPLTTSSAVTALVGSQAHRDIAREAVRKSLVLLKTTAGLLPLSKTAKITLVGPHAQNVGLQCGGWTLGWQGVSGNQMPGTTIMQGFQSVGGSSNISYSADGNTITGDVAVVCIGEQPYAETQGDIPDGGVISSFTVPEENLVTNAKKSTKPVVCVLITGRPMDISAMVSSCDAIVAAWLPGTEGGGIAEVLYGTYEFTGKLSMSWPTNEQQEPINTGDANYTPLYPYDYGLNSAGKQLPAGLY